MSIKASNFIITINNPELSLDEYAAIAKRLEFTYARLQLEKGANGTPHV